MKPWNMRDKKGLLTFEIDLNTKNVKEAEWRPGGIFHSYSGTEGSSTVETYLLVRRDNCYYLKALNLANAKCKASRL